MGVQAPPKLECRMYEAKHPPVDTAVMVKVKSVSGLCAYVSLLEYNAAEGMILLSELSRRRIRSIPSLIKVGRVETVMVLGVDGEYINLSKRRVAPEDIHACVERYSKSKLVHSIMRHVAETTGFDLEDLYIHVGWPLYRKYGHAFEAFRLIVSDPDSILDSCTRQVKEVGSEVVHALWDEVKAALVKDIRRRMTPHPLKIQADVEMKCYQIDGILHIKEAMRRAEAVGNGDCPVKITVAASPKYVLTTQTLDKWHGISVLNEAIAACSAEIERHQGKLVLKMAPRAVTEHEEEVLLSERLALDEGVSEEEEVGSDEDFGDLDLEDD